MTMKKIYLIAEDWTLWEHTTPRARQYHPTECHLMGWLVQEDRGKVVLAMEWMPSPYGDDLRHTVAIPRVCIKAMWELTGMEKINHEKPDQKD